MGVRLGWREINEGQSGAGPDWNGMNFRLGTEVLPPRSVSAKTRRGGVLVCFYLIFHSRHLKKSPSGH